MPFITLILAVSSEQWYKRYTIKHSLLSVILIKARCLPFYPWLSSTGLA